MGSVFLDVLPWAVAIALTPIAVTAVVLLLGSRDGLAKSAALLAGDAGAMVVVAAFCVAFAGGEGFAEDGTPAKGMLLGGLIAGLTLTSLSAWAIGRQVKLRASGRSAAQKLPTWLNAVDKVGVLLAFGIGVANMTLNVGNLFFTVSGSATIANHDLGSGEEALAIALFVVVATSTVWLPIATYALVPDRSDVLLERLRAWIGSNGFLVLDCILLLIGLNLIGAAVAGLS